MSMKMLIKIWFRITAILFGSNFAMLLVSVLGQLEVEFKLYLKGFECWDKLDDESKIPKNNIYCSDCPYRTHSMIVNLIYGSQCDGYCYYLNRGDFSYINSTMLLWDGCKECGVSVGGY